MANESLGSGLYVDQNLDFDPSSTGDLRTVSGSDELQKDLSLQLLVNLDRFRGQPLDAGVAAEIKSITVDVIRADSRINYIDKGSLRVIKTDRTSLTIEAFVQASGEEQELVFEL